MSDGEQNGATFDIGTLQTTVTADLPIVHPVTGNPTNWIWTLAGPSHPKTVEASNIAARDALNLQRQREQAIANRRKWVEPDKSPDQMRAENARSFALRVLDWTPVKMNGAEYPYSNENVIALLLNPAYGKIYNQLLDYFNSDESFMEPSETT
jgi:hypothetical protein